MVLFEKIKIIYNQFIKTKFFKIILIINLRIKGGGGFQPSCNCTLYIKRYIFNYYFELHFLITIS